MLDIKTRQMYLKELGIYGGNVDGVEGSLTKKAYKDLQNRYFTRLKDRDGIYGVNTDILLQNVYRVKKYTKHFKLTEFKCKCNGKYCTGYPAILSVNLLKNIEAIRDYSGTTTISSGLRCKTWNSKQKGSSATSKHLSGKAIDFSNRETKSIEGRKNIISYWFTLNSPNYAYSNGWFKLKGKSGKIKASYMGNSVHGDVL